MVLSSIQALRFVATLLVLLFHLALLPSGFKGVDLFFVISGFVLYYTYHSRPSVPQKQRRRYFVHRLTKIYLLYWTALIALYPVQPYPFDRNFLANILLLPGHNPLLDISWSLSCELYFYALLGITLFYIPPRWHKGLFITAFVVTAGIKLFNTFIFSLHGTPVYFLAGPNLWEFLCGILAGYIFCRSATTPAATGSPAPNRATTYGPIALLLLILFWALPILRSAPYYHFVYGPVATALVITTALAEKATPWKGTLKKIVIRLGNASYAIYLFGPVLVRIIKPHIHELPWKIAAIAILITFSLLINHFYEEKLLRIVRRSFGT
ncbi:MAG TPA: acyltransferase [Puia sp.]|jgi:exopolysaccharide production protein ExoZ